MSATLDQTLGPATVRNVAGDSAIRRRLAEMGVRPGAQIRVLYRTTGGARVIAVEGARVALDADLARAVTLEAENA
ncbi:MAG TPA: FeoA family protein [Actinomycetota bacterium]|nr:FeoA family protein [Actinomycetota bacterium]